MVKAKKSSQEPVYKVVEVIGTSPKSWEEAASNAVARAAETLRDLRIAEVVKQDMKVEEGKVVAYRTRVLLSFVRELANQLLWRSGHRVHRACARQCSAADARELARRELEPT
jgi:flavin-binding protein dodecin